MIALEAQIRRERLGRGGGVLVAVNGSGVAPGSGGNPNAIPPFGKPGR